MTTIPQMATKKLHFSTDNPGGELTAPFPNPMVPRLAHSIPHRWQKTLACGHFTDECRVCQKSLGCFWVTKCQTCHYMVHQQCTLRIGNWCGLTPGHVKIILTDAFLESRCGPQDHWNYVNGVRIAQTVNVKLNPAKALRQTEITNSDKTKKMT